MQLRLVGKFFSGALSSPLPLSPSFYYIVAWLGVWSGLLKGMVG